MGGSGSREDCEPVIHFTDEERENISQMFSKISHGKKVLTKDQLQSYTGSILNEEVSGHMYELMVLTGRKHHPEGGVNLQQFMHCLSSLLRGSVSERAHIVTYLSAEGRSQVTSEQLLRFVTMLIYSFARVAENHINYKSWVLHRSEESYNQLALCVLEDLFHEGDAKEKGMRLPVVPEAVYSEREIEDWLSRSNLILQIFEQVFHGCFHVYSSDENLAHNLTPRIPEAGMVNWANMKTILDFPSLLFLNSILPQDKQTEWRLVFSNRVFGDSFTQLAQKITMKGPTVVIVSDKDGHMFGGYASQHWDFNAKFTGDSQCLLFSLKPHYGVYTTTGYNDHFMYLNHHVQTLPNGLGMGGQFEYFGLWIDHTFSCGHSKAGPRCTTYGSPQLSGKPDFDVDVIEVWSVGPEKKVDDDDITDESRKKKSILDKDPQAMAMLSLIGKGPVSDGLREEDDTKDIPEHNQVISLF